ncbi:MAG: hypothetical protein P4M07_05445 [Xanthobacteraceae bacterium]|nr:hypothetical protein [Xanthobacteraceae bacterium]
MTNATPFPPRLILAAAVTSGLLLALAVHTIGQRFGLDLGTLWRSEAGMIPASAAIAWWLVALIAFVGGHTAAILFDRAASGHVPPLLRQFLIVVVVLVLAAAGQAASAPSAIPTVAGVLSGLAALGLGGAMAFCGAHFALYRS